MQLIETRGGIVAALHAGLLQDLVAGARSARARAFATRRETITGVTDYPLLGAALPEVAGPRGPRAFGTAMDDDHSEPLSPIRWAAPFEALRDRAEAKSPRPSVFFANLGTLPQFAPRAQFARNLFAAGGVGAIGEEIPYEARDAMIYALRESRARVAVICGTDPAYAEDGENAAQRLKAGGADWVILAGKPGANEAALRAAGVDQFLFAGQDALKELETLHAALGLGA
jgi:methylmalonyl-CoA mutase